jgi:HAD superfamily hydrolase (TIGR01509 family)
VKGAFDSIELNAPFLWYIKVLRTIIEQITQIDMKYNCILFDCDGVLVDTERATIQVLIEMSKAAGLNLEIEEGLTLFGGHSLQYCFDYINNHSPNGLQKDAEIYFRKKTFQAYQDHMTAIPNIEQVLKDLNVPICVASNGPLEKIKLNLTLTGLIEYFDGNLYSAYQLKKWKPLPDLFWYAAQEMGFEVEECAVIEDSLAGVEAAVAGGFDVYAIVNERNRASLQAAGAMATFENMNQLMALLSKQTTR